MHSALLLVLSLVMLLPSIQAADAADLKLECQKVVDQDTVGTDFSALVQICREILAKDALEPEQQMTGDKRGYDFIRFGRSDGGANKKASGSYDYIRFGKRSV